MTLLDRLSPFRRTPPPPGPDAVRLAPPSTAVEHRRYSIAEWAQAAQFSFGGSTYGISSSMFPGANEERIPESMAGFTRAAYMGCGPVFACIMARQMVFAEGRFAFQRRERGRPGPLFGTAELGILEDPWPGGSTGELLARMEQDVSLAGNSFWIRRNDRLVRLRPDRVRIIVGHEDPSVAPWSVDSRLLGYAYWPEETSTPDLFLPEEVAHYSPIPDPMARYRGMSWLGAVLADVELDRELTQLKSSYFARAAMPSGHFHVDPEAGDAEIDRVARMIREYFIGPSNAGRILITSAKWESTSHSMIDSEIQAIQGAGETRIAAAAGVPPIVAGFSEGLKSATYSNYGQARRRFADGTMRPLWRTAAAALANLIDVPADAELVVDTRYIAALREDEAEQASILNKQALAIQQLVFAGFEPDAVAEAVAAGDLRRLRNSHTGAIPVQLIPPTDQGKLGATVVDLDDGANT